VPAVERRDNRDNGAGAPADPDTPGTSATVSTDVLQALVAFLDDVVEQPTGAGEPDGESSCGDA
jgi:hypothetical protein